MKTPAKTDETKSQCAVIYLLCNGFKRKEIAVLGGITPFCVNEHVKAYKKKSGYKTLIEMVAKHTRKGYIKDMEPHKKVFYKQLIKEIENSKKHSYVGQKPNAISLKEIYSTEIKA